MDQWYRLKVLIIGAARQGVALARFFLRRGARVVMNDQQPVEAFTSLRQELEKESDDKDAVKWVFGGHPVGLLDEVDLICLSGGVPADLPLVIEARDRGMTVTNDSQIFLETTPCKVIGITGSAGKTTTTTLVGRIAQAAVSSKYGTSPYRQAWVGGNIGSPLISVVDEMVTDDLAIMELSSFQLELMSRSPQIAAVLNITPNHLDRHKTMDAYSAAKRRILDFQSGEDVAVLGRDDPGAMSLESAVKGELLTFGINPLVNDHAGTFFANDTVYLKSPDNFPEAVKLLDRQAISLRGEHNLLNVMAACTISQAAGLDREVMEAGINGFTGVSHRLEFVRSWGGADWYNDSIATAPERSMAAIRSFDEPLILLAGGRDKKLPWDEFARLVKRRVDHLVLFGEAADIIVNALDLEGGEPLTVSLCQGLHQAVQAAAELVQPGDVVLLSPGGTSFDEFKDFEERGECFIQWVKNLV